MEIDYANLIKGIIGSLVRFLFAGIVGGLVTAGVITAQQGELLIPAITLGVITVVWAIWRKYKIQERIALALSLPAGSDPERLEQAVQSKNPPTLRTVAVPFLICALVTQTACGELTVVGVMAGSTVLLATLEDRKEITPEQRKTLQADFDAGLRCGTDLEDELDQIAKDDPDAKAKRLNAWTRTSNFCWKPIVLRQNFAMNERVQRVANLITDLFAAGVAFYAGQSGAGAGRAAAPAAKDEKVFERDLEGRLKHLKQAMKP
jgi:hypothetical protein